MNPESLPWEKGIGVVLAMALLGIILDMVYRILPRGFRLVRRAIDKQTLVITDKHEEAIERVNGLEAAVKHLETVNADALAKIARTRTRTRAKKVKRRQPG